MKTPIKRFFRKQPNRYKKGAIAQEAKWPLVCTKAYFRMKFGTILLYGIVLGLILVLPAYFQYQFRFMTYGVEWHIGFIALLFLVIGVWVGNQLWANRKLESAQNTPIVRSGNPGAPGLSQREFEVLCGIAEGLSNQEIASKMHVSLNTVKTHVANLYDKLDVKRRTQAVQVAKTLGLLS